MRLFSILVCLLLSFCILGQSTIEKVVTEVRYEDQQFHVAQTLYFNLSGSTETIELKALRFKNMQIGVVDISGFKYVQQHGDDLIRITLHVESIDSVELRYTVKATEKVFYLPLFFTNLAAASSEDGFFKMDLLAQSQSIHVHFPTVETREITEEGVNRSSIELPALISGVRLELLDDSESPSDIVAIVDWSVALLFAGIGFLIWYNRKKLIYG
ncbi:MAG: hypothetical protein ABJG78_20680 [Cyclobacteriaceae bacterium]